MPNKMVHFLLLIIILLMLVPINYYLFKGNPNLYVEQVEEKVIEDVTGIEVDLNPK